MDLNKLTHQSDCSDWFVQMLSKETIQLYSECHKPKWFLGFLKTGIRFFYGLGEGRCQQDQLAEGNGKNKHITISICLKLNVL